MYFKYKFLTSARIDNMKEKKLFTCPILDKICPILVIFQQILLYIGLETRYVPQILLINYLMSTRINIPNEKKKNYSHVQHVRYWTKFVQYWEFFNK